MDAQFYAIEEILIRLKDRPIRFNIMTSEYLFVDNGFGKR
jgi:hypothetical protein